MKCNLSRFSKLLRIWVVVEHCCSFFPQNASSIEAAASHEAAAIEQKARGMLERQKLTNAQSSEREMARLLELRSITAAVESTGQAVAEARAQAEKLSIEGHSEIQGQYMFVYSLCKRKCRVAGPSF